MNKVNELFINFVNELNNLDDWQKQDEIINDFLSECRERKLGSMG